MKLSKMEGNQMQYKTLIVDGPYFIHRAHSAPYHLSTKDGLDATIIHTATRSLNFLRKKFNPDKIILTWESHGTESWRRKQNPNYKETKIPLAQKFIDEIKDFQTLLYLFKVKQFYAPRNEADDVIAKLTTLEKRPIIIHTTDKDIMQLITNDIHIWTGKEIVNEEKVREKFKVEPKYIPDLLAIAGDTADNIQGIKGVGYKKAAKLINEFGMVEQMSIFGNLSNSIKIQEQVLKNKRLTQLNMNCELHEVPNKDFKTDHTIESIMDKYNLKQMKEKIEEYKLLKGKH